MSRPPVNLLLQPPVSLLLLAYGVLLVVGCAPLSSSRPDVCTFVREQVSAGNFPLQLAITQYPECKAVSKK